MKVLVVYYSLSGKTKLVAETIAKNLNAEIRRVEDLKTIGICGIVSGAIKSAMGVGGLIKPMDFDIHNYDLIFIGTPVWAFKPTPAINTFVAKTDFKDKKVVVFFTMGGCGYKCANKSLCSAIESKGGKVINSFTIRTGGVKNEKIIEKGNEIGNQYKSVI